MKSRLIRKHILRAVLAIIFAGLASIWIVTPYFKTGGQNRKYLVETEAHAGVTEKNFGGMTALGGSLHVNWNNYSTFTYEVNGRRYTDKRSGDFYGEVTIYYDPKNPSYYVLTNASPVKTMLLRGTTCLFLGFVIPLLAIRENKKAVEKKSKKRSDKVKTKHPFGSSNQYPWSRKT